MDTADTLKNDYFHEMTSETNLTITGAVAILLFDTLGSLLSAHLHFRYALLWPASLALYVVLTYRAAAHLTFQRAIGFGAFLGLLDSTIGWKLSVLLGADPEGYSQRITRGVFAGIVCSVVLTGALVALVTFLTANRRNHKDGQ